MLTAPVWGCLLQTRKGISFPSDVTAGKSISLVIIQGANSSISSQSSKTWESHPSPSGPSMDVVQSLSNFTVARFLLFPVPNGGAIRCQQTALSTSLYFRPKSKTSVFVPPHAGWRIIPMEHPSPAARYGASSTFTIHSHPCRPFTVSRSASQALLIAVL